MKKSVITVYSLLVVLAIVGLIGWIGFSYFTGERENRESFLEDAPSLNAKINDLLDRTQDTGSPDFKEGMEELVAENPNLKGVLIYSGDDKLFYNRIETKDNRLLENLKKNEAYLLEKIADDSYKGPLGISHDRFPLKTIHNTPLSISYLHETYSPVEIYSHLLMALYIISGLFVLTLAFLMLLTARERKNSVENNDDFFEPPAHSDLENSPEDISEGFDEGRDDGHDFDLPDEGEDAMDLDLPDEEEDAMDLDLPDEGEDDMDFVLPDEGEDAMDFDLPDEGEDAVDFDLPDEGEDAVDFDLPDEGEDAVDFDLPDEGDDFPPEMIELSDLDDIEEDGIDDVNPAEELEQDDKPFPEDLDEEDQLSLEGNEGDSEEELEGGDLFDENDLLDDDIPEDSDLDENFDLPDLNDFMAENGDEPLEDLSEDDLIDLDESDGDQESPVETNESQEEGKQQLYSPRSNVCWEDFIDERLPQELDRVSRENDDLSFIYLRDQSVQTDDQYALFSEQLTQDFPYRDLIFEWGDQGFAIILPSTDLVESLEKLDVFVNEHPDRDIRVGATSRNGRLLDKDQLLEEASSAIHRTSGDNRIIGFRADPVRYREALGQKEE